MRIKSIAVRNGSAIVQFEDVITPTPMVVNEGQVLFDRQAPYGNHVIIAELPDDPMISLEVRDEKVVFVAP